MNKKLVKDNAKSFDDREGHSRDLNMMRCARHPKALPPCHIHAFIPAHLRSQNLFHRIRASAFKPPHSRGSHAAAACTEPHLCSRSHTLAFTPPHVCCSIHAAAFFRRCHAAALMPSLSRCHIYAAEFTPQHAPRRICRRMHAAAFTSLSRRSIGAVALTPQR